MHPEAERLAHAWIKDFWAANHAVTWLAVEQEALLWLDKRTLLVGKRDAIGQTEDAAKFFLENKTASKTKAGSGKYAAEKRMALKREWKMNPQSLTYGVLGAAECRDFQVRWTFKTDPATTDFEWYSYSDVELDWWKGELLAIGEEIRHHRHISHHKSDIKRYPNWPVNLKHCTRYGEAFKCLFRDEGCHVLNFEYMPDAYSPRTESHLQIENDIKAQADHILVEGSYMLRDGELVILDATRVDDWYGCHELYRRKWEPWLDKESGKAYDGIREENEALLIGHDFHELTGAHLKQIKEKQNAAQSKV